MSARRAAALVSVWWLRIEAAEGGGSIGGAHNHTEIIAVVIKAAGVL